MFMVTMTYGDDVFVEADDYEVDEDGDLVFLVEGDEEVDEVDENGHVESGRVRSHAWSGVFSVDVCEDEDEDEDEDEVE